MHLILQRVDLEEMYMNLDMNQVQFKHFKPAARHAIAIAGGGWFGDTKRIPAPDKLPLQLHMIQESGIQCYMGADEDLIIQRFPQDDADFAKQYLVEKNQKTDLPYRGIWVFVTKVGDL